MGTTLPRTLLLTSLLLSGAAASAEPTVWFGGSWSGKGFQDEVSQTWSIVEANLDLSAHAYSIRYPSLDCAGRWELVTLEPHRVVFRESIQRGLERCVNGGTVVLTQVKPGVLSYTFLGTEGQPSAMGMLLRAKGSPKK